MDGWSRRTGGVAHYEVGTRRAGSTVPRSLDDIHELRDTSRARIVVDRRTRGREVHACAPDTGRLRQARSILRAQAAQVIPVIGRSTRSPTPSGVERVWRSVVIAFTRSFVALPNILRIARDARYVPIIPYSSVAPSHPPFASQDAPGAPTSRPRQPGFSRRS